MGSKAIVVGVTDTGIDYMHPDLSANVWSNPGGINGCAAGTHGYNVLAATCDPMDDDTSYNGHGTHVSGIIGAATNNGIGVAGVNWSTNLLAVKWLASTGNGTTSDLITALDWLSRRIPTTTPCLAAVCPSPRSPRGRDAHVVVVTNGD